MPFIDKCDFCGQERPVWRKSSTGMKVCGTDECEAKHAERLPLTKKLLVKAPLILKIKGETTYLRLTFGDAEFLHSIGIDPECNPENNL